MLIIKWSAVDQLLMLVLLNVWFIEYFKKFWLHGLYQSYLRVECPMGRMLHKADVVLRDELPTGRMWSYRTSDPIGWMLYEASGLTEQVPYVANVVLQDEYLTRRVVLWDECPTRRMVLPDKCPMGRVVLRDECPMGRVAHCRLGEAWRRIQAENKSLEKNGM